MGSDADHIDHAETAVEHGNLTALDEDL